MATMKRKRYCSPVVNVFDVRAAQTLLSGSPQPGTTVVPGEEHDPGLAETRRSFLWDDPDEEDFEEDF